MSQPHGKSIAGDNGNVGAPGQPKSVRARPAAWLRQFSAAGLVEYVGEALLGGGKILDRDQDHDGSDPAWAALSAADGWFASEASTWRARSAFSSAVVMMVLAQQTRSPEA